MRLLLGVLTLFAGLLLALPFMLLKTVGWLATPHPVSVALDVICIVLAVTGVVMSGLRVLQLMERTEKPAPAHARRPPVHDEPLP